jgi:hypothetical protein
VSYSFVGSGFANNTREMQRESLGNSKEVKFWMPNERSNMPPYFTVYYITKL